MYNVALSLGTNSGDRRAYLFHMEKEVENILSGSVKKSPVYETEPLEVNDVQPWFLNRIMSGNYTGSAMELLRQCQHIERLLGRTGKGLRTERTADIDILLFGSQHLETPELILPHPALLRRRFCMEGLESILPDAVIGLSGRTVHQHYTTMDSELRQQKLTIVTEEEHH